MRKPRDLLDKIWESVRGQSEAHTKLLKRCSVLATILLPILFALVTTFKSEWFTNYDKLFWFILAALIILQLIFGSFVIYSSKSTYDVLIYSNDIYKQYQEKRNMLEDAERDLKLQTFLASYSKNWINQIPYLADNIRNDPKNLKDSLNDIFSVVTEDEDSIILLEPKEHIKFVLYIYDEMKDELLPLWKQETTSGKKIVDNNSRVWKPGEGHVGIAFNQGGTICTADATESNVANAFRAPQTKLKEYDEELYKSFSSVTLFNGSGNKIGVLAATSNHKGRFEPNTYAQFVNLASSVVSAILHNQHIKDIIASNTKV
ncbi:MAG: hypothetical protein R3D86_04875 [Emcibacteraceae bacterium]